MFRILVAILPAIGVFSILINQGAVYIFNADRNFYIILLYIFIFYLPVFPLGFFLKLKNYPLNQLSVSSIIMLYIKAELSAVLLHLLILLGIMVLTNNTILTWMFILLLFIAQIPAITLFRKDIKLIIKPLNQKK